jgi:hypothetical protein
MFVFSGVVGPWMLDLCTPMAHIHTMKFVETSIFTKEITKLLPDDSYRMLQTSLMLRPDRSSKGAVDCGKFAGVCPDLENADLCV